MSPDFKKIGAEFPSHTRTTELQNNVLAAVAKIASGDYESGAAALHVIRWFKAWWRPLSRHRSASNTSVMLTDILDS